MRSVQDGEPQYEGAVPTKADRRMARMQAAATRIQAHARSRIVLRTMGIMRAAATHIQARASVKLEQKVCEGEIQIWQNLASSGVVPLEH